MCSAVTELAVAHLYTGIVTASLKDQVLRRPPIPWVSNFKGDSLPNVTWKLVFTRNNDERIGHPLEICGVSPFVDFEFPVSADIQYIEYKGFPHAALELYILTSRTTLWRLLPLFTPAWAISMYTKVAATTQTTELGGGLETRHAVGGTL